MTLLKNIFEIKIAKHLVSFLIVLCFTLPAFAQENGKVDAKWMLITQKHDIKSDSYTLHGDYFIIGKKSVDGKIENFKDVTVISIDSENYWIYLSETASYNSETKTLKINDCKMDKYQKNSKSLDPLQTFKHINYSVNLEKNEVFMSNVE